jgi:hypothetical protein
MDIDISDAPHTREVVLDGLRQALQARVATIWNNVTLAGEPNSVARFKDGMLKAITHYEQAWNAINDTLPNDE